MKLSGGILFALLSLFVPATASADTTATFQLPSGVTVRIVEAPFRASQFKVEGCSERDSACRINGRIPFGTAFGLPKTYVKSITVSFGVLTYSLNASDMYDAWGARPPEVKGVIRYFGGRCFDSKNCRFRGLFSDAAGTFVAEWNVVNGAPVRTVLTASDDVVELFTRNINPPSTYSEELFGTSLAQDSRTDVISPDKQWFVSIQRDPGSVAMLTLSSTTADTPQHILPLQRSGWVLWSPDSRRFAFTDAAFANHYFVRICEVNIRDAPCRDFSSLLEAPLRRMLAADSQIDKVYSKALKWLSHEQLLVGVHVASLRLREARGNWTPLHYHFQAVILDAVSGTLVSELTPSQAALRIGQSLESLEW